MPHFKICSFIFFIQFKYIFCPKCSLKNGFFFMEREKGHKFRKFAYLEVILTWGRILIFRLILTRFILWIYCDKVSSYYHMSLVKSLNILWQGFQLLSHVSCIIQHNCSISYGFWVKIDCSKIGAGGSPCRLAAVVSCCARRSPTKCQWING